MDETNLAEMFRKEAKQNVLRALKIKILEKFYNSTDEEYRKATQDVIAVIDNAINNVHLY
ncbi:MAG: hypothetical protein LBN97_02310 [Oscillospiraceae bacterium]|jgi:hypothetical protein|nr:hypothetical protein [Oscillospiraceae bacterium]